METPLPLAHTATFSEMLVKLSGFTEHLELMLDKKERARLLLALSTSLRKSREATLCRVEGEDGIYCYLDLSLVLRITMADTDRPMPIDGSPGTTAQFTKCSFRAIRTWQRNSRKNSRV